MAVLIKSLIPILSRLVLVVVLVLGGLGGVDAASFSASEAEKVTVISDAGIEKIRAWETVFTNPALRKDPLALTKISKYLDEIGDSPSALKQIFDQVPANAQQAFVNALDDLAELSVKTGKKLKVKFNPNLQQVARGSQGSGAYPGIDNWIVVEIPAGTKVYGGVPGQSNFYTPYETLSDASLSKPDVWKSLQVEPHPQFGYRSQVAEYELGGTVEVSFSKVAANPQHGNGGAFQYFVETFQSQVRATGNVIDLQ